MACEATQLMLATKRGERGAYDELVKRLRSKAYALAHSLVGSRDDAMELCQETFFKIYRARESFRDGEPFLPWFHRILRNTCYSFLRERGRASERSISALPPGADPDEGDWQIRDDEAPAPSEGLEQDERALLFQKALSRLSAHDREILVLRHYQELSYKQIASTLAIPEGTVMSRLFHARRRLRDFLPQSLLSEIGEGQSKAKGDLR
ncbi:MAG: RNA polymerase sigma factor [Planctomycetes bacterium]|nr:RNA polymerase sigma factor [Planctomycetota bacterium]